jgi:hypothetical protein
VDAPTPEERADWLGRLGDQEMHHRRLDELPCLNQIVSVGVRLP